MAIVDARSMNAAGDEPFEMILSAVASLPAKVTFRRRS